MTQVCRDRLFELVSWVFAYLFVYLFDFLLSFCIFLANQISLRRACRIQSQARKQKCSTSSILVMQREKKKKRRNEKSSHLWADVSYVSSTFHHQPGNFYISNSSSDLVSYRALFNLECLQTCTGGLFGFILNYPFSRLGQVDFMKQQEQWSRIFFLFI